MPVIITIAVIVYAISVYGAYELGRYERRNERIIIDEMTTDRNFADIKRIWEA